MSHDICTILERVAKDLLGWNPTGFNPALLTASEYGKAMNRKDKWHGADSYDFDVEKMNQYGSNPKDYRLVRRFKARGLDFEMMVRVRQNRYVKHDSDDEIMRDQKGMAKYHSEEEANKLGLKPHDYSVAIFHDGKRVALAEDEWGAMLIVVAREYRGFGLGPLIGKFARTLEPAKDSGGFTNDGYRNLMKIHRDLVRDALVSGLYSKLVKSGELSQDRALDIITSAHLHIKRKDKVDLAANDPEQWLLYSDHNGTFVLYDRKLKDVIHEDVAEQFMENMIRGMVCVMIDETVGVARIKRFGAETVKLKAFMLSLAYTLAKTHEVELVVETSEYDLPKFAYGKETRVAGYASKPVLSGPIVDYRAMVDVEKRFRKSFDQHGEFGLEMHQIADSKYQ